MDELSSLIVLIGTSAAVGSAATVVFGLIVSIYLNTRKIPRENEEDESLVIPYSALMGGIAGGGGHMLSPADVMRARAAMAAAQGGAPPEDGKDKDKKPEMSGTYL